MEVFLEILKLTLPSLAVVAVVYFMLREYFESEHKRAMMELQFKQTSTTLPIKINAYERLSTQQVYVSDNLWKIIKIARDDVQNTINHVYQTIDPDADSKDFAQALYEFLGTKDVLPLHKALEAVKKEASLILQ